MLPAAPPFVDREQAGRELAERLGFLAGREDLVVVGLSPGGVLVAADLAQSLDASLETMALLRAHPAPCELRSRTVVIVDDGLSSGLEVLAAAGEVIAQLPRNLIVASPVLAAPVANELHALGVEVDSLFTDEVERRGAGPSWYAQSGVPSEATVRFLLGSARRRCHWREEVAAG